MITPVNLTSQHLAKRGPVPAPRALGLVNASEFVFAEGPRKNVPAGCPLTDREYEFLCHLSRGLTYKEAAREMGVAPSTLTSLAHTAYGRLGLQARGITTAVVLMKDSGWLGAPTRPPQLVDDSRDVTAVQLAYASCFVRLCRERTPHAAALVTVAFCLLSAVHGLEASGKRRVPDIDALLLSLARRLRRPIYDGLADASIAARIADGPASITSSRSRSTQ